MTKQQKYPTDLTDEQVEFIKQFLPASNNFGRPRLDIAQVLNAIFYVVVGGIAWRMLPQDFPHWKSVYHYFRQWRRSGEWERIYNRCSDKVYGTFGTPLDLPRILNT